MFTRTELLPELRIAPEEHPQLTESISDQEIAAYLRLKEVQASAGANSGGFGGFGGSGQGMCTAAIVD